MGPKIHPTAIIDERAVIDPSTTIGPYVIIEGDARIGKDNNIMARAFIGEGTTIGDGNTIHMGAVVGHAPQDKAFKGGNTFLRVGNNNTIREYATIHRGTLEGSETVIGDGCLIMGGCHIAHDCKLHNDIIMANMSGIAGYVEVGNRAVISGGVMIHQFVRVGTMAMVGGNARISMDIPPFMIAAEKNQVWGVNTTGLTRAALPSETIKEIRTVYRLFFRNQAPIPERLQKIEESNLTSDAVREFVKFVRSSKRGICAPAHMSG